MSGTGKPHLVCMQNDDNGCEMADLVGMLRWHSCMSIEIGKWV
jgi:hypothetical protein